MLKVTFISSPAYSVLSRCWNSKSTVLLFALLFPVCLYTTVPFRSLTSSATSKLRFSPPAGNTIPSVSFVFLIVALIRFCSTSTHSIGFFGDLKVKLSALRSMYINPVLLLLAFTNSFFSLAGSIVTVNFCGSSYLLVHWDGIVTFLLSLPLIQSIILSSSSPHS